MKRIVVAGDFHIPYADPILLDLFYKFLIDFTPEILVINGDFLDCWSISKFDKVPSPNRTIENEVEIGRRVLTRIREIIPNAEIYYIEGNHEFRLRQYVIRNAPAVYKMIKTLQELLDLDSFGVQWVGTKEGASRWVDTYKRFGELYIGHWNRVSKHGGYTAKNLLDDKGVSLIQNHTHRGGAHYRTLENGEYLVAYENFCMCDLSPDYMGNPNWMQGWTVIYSDVDEGSGRFHAYQIPVIGYKFYWAGKVYEVNLDLSPRKLVVDVL